MTAWWQDDLVDELWYSEPAGRSGYQQTWTTPVLVMCRIETQINVVGSTEDEEAIETTRVVTSSQLKKGARVWIDGVARTDENAIKVKGSARARDLLDPTLVMWESIIG